jgi:hypothetical protein
LDILAYILYANDLPAGPSDLTVSVADRILLVGPEGPKPFPPSSSVRVVGCLVQTSGAWSLDHGTTPIRVRDAAQTNPAELEKSAQAILGAEQFRLTNLEDDHPAAELQALSGKKVQVKGVLNGQGESARISVLSFKSLNGECK